MRNWTVLVVVVFAVFCTVEPARAAKKKKAFKVLFVGPLSGGSRSATEAYLEGVRESVAGWTETDPLEGRPIELIVVDDGDDPKQGTVAAAIKLHKPVAVLGAPTGRCVAGLTKLSRKKKVPLVLLTPWIPSFTLDPKDTIVHLSANHVDHAIWAANYATMPFQAAKAVALHDGSPGGSDLAAAFLRNLGMRTHSGGSHAMPEDADTCAALVKKLTETDLADFAFVCGDTASALRVAEAVNKSEKKLKLLFCDGLVVPELTASAPEGSRWLEGFVNQAEREMLGRFRRTREKAKKPASPLAEKGYWSFEFFMDGFRRNKLKAKGLTQAIRSVPDEKWRNTPLCTEWGEPKLYRYFLYYVKDKVTQRYPPLYLWAHNGGTLLRHRSPKDWKCESDGIAVVLTFGDKKKRTIHEDMKRIGLNTGGYEGPMDDWIQEELLARCMAYLNKMYWRNADGTAIPGVSFNISFGLEPPEGVKSHKIWVVTIAGDDPKAGGRAFPPNKAFTFSTFLERTLYRKHALKPKLATPDVKFFIGRYVWGSSKERNIRHDAIRSLVNGFAGAMALTTAHECGHLGGLSHDQVTNRSIMNVVDAIGLDPESAEWVPAHRKTLTTSIGRVAAPKKRDKKKR